MPTPSEIEPLRRDSMTALEHSEEFCTIGPRAVEMSIYVVRAFVKLRDRLSSNGELARRFAQLETRPPRATPQCANDGWCARFYFTRWCCPWKSSTQPLEQSCTPDNPH